MWIRISDLEGLVPFSVIYLIVLTGVGSRVVQSILHHRRVERAYRIRLAHWRAASEARSA